MKGLEELGAFGKITSDQRVPVSRNPAAVRARVLEAAFAEFADYGYESAKVDRIADRFGGAKTTIFRHFNNKRDLFIAVIENAIRKWSAPLSMAGVDSSEPEFWLEAYAIQILRWLLSDEMIFVANMADYHRREFPEIVEIFNRLGRMDHLPILVERIIAWCEAGLLHSTDPQADADDFLSIIVMRMLNKRKMEDAPYPQEEAMRLSVRRSVNIFLYGRATSQILTSNTQ